MSLVPPEPQEVPLIDPDRLLQWMYRGGEPILVVLEGHRMISLPNPPTFAEVLSLSENGGYEWVLIDGPRPTRPSWVIDPWWIDRPELSQRIISLTRAHCVTIDQLRQSLTTFMTV